MAMISIRLNTEEEKMIDFLSQHYEEEKSSLIKHSLKDMYEDLIDRKVIDEFETKEQNEEVKFLSADQILSSLS
jgi:predicted DNA-binding protein